jgi:RNA polymerase sigma factor (TIGR02999 family)
MTFSPQPLAPGEITARLAAWNRGEEGALEELIPYIYAELRQLAHQHLRKEAECWSVQPTELVNEVFLRITGLRKPDWKNRAHFFGACSAIMRNILVDFARKRRAAKRRGDGLMVEFNPDLSSLAKPAVDFEGLDEALNELAELDARQAKIIELRFFGGLTLDETAEVVQLSPATVKREWASARAWLLRRLDDGR